MTEYPHLRLLVVDADDASRDQLTQTLRHAGYANVTATGDVAGAGRLFVIEQPDLILLDMDAPASQRTLHDVRRLRDAPAVALLGGDADAGRRQAILDRTRDFVVKPIEEAELLLRVRNLLETRELHSQLQDRSARLTEAIRDAAPLHDTQKLVSKAFNGTMPSITRHAIAVSTVVRRRWYLILGGSVAAFVGFRTWKSSAVGRPVWDRLRLKAPAKIGPVVQKVALAS